MPPPDFNEQTGKNLPARSRHVPACRRDRPPVTRAIEPVGWLRGALWVLSIFALWGQCELAAVAQTVARAPIARQLRISWGGGAAATWQGEVRISSGAMKLGAVLGMEPDAGAAINVVGRSFRLGTLRPSGFGGAIVDCQDEGNVWLEIEFFSNESPDVRLRQSMPLAQILASPSGDGARWQLDHSGNVLEIRTLPGSELPLEINRRHLVFSPGETFVFSLLAVETPFAAGSRAKLRVQLTPARSLVAVDETSVEVQIDSQQRIIPREVEIRLPESQGAWDVRLELAEESFPVRIGWTRPRIERNFQVVVVDDTPRADAPVNGTALWREVMASGVTDNPWVPKLPALPPLRLTAGAKRHDAGARTIEREGREFTELAPGGWQALPLRISEMGTPHIVEIEYIDQGPMALGISVLQPDESGTTQPFGADSGISIPDDFMSSVPVVRRHRFFFWPRHKSPYLLFANRHASAPAVIGSIHVLAGPETLAPSPAWQGETRDASIARRQFMAFYEQPLFVDNFASSRRFDSQTGLSIDDWQSWLTGAERWAEYLKASGYTGAMIVVTGDGSSLYPSPLIQPTSGFDNAALASSPLDPMRKDVVELLLRVFSREGLQLVPLVNFNAPIPALERSRNAPGKIMTGILISSSDGPTTTGGQLQRAVPESIYNPLHPEVQAACAEVMGELVERCKAHKSFAGPGLLLSRNSLPVIPGQSWCGDEATIRRFAASRNEVLATGMDAQFLDRVMEGPSRDAWLAWRQSEMARWYARLVELAVGDSGSRKLFLVGTDLFDAQDAFSALAPSLRRVGDLGTAAARIGLPTDAIADDPAMVFLRPHQIAPEKPLAASRLNYQLDGFDSPSGTVAASSRGVAMIRQCSWAHFEQLQGTRPFGQPASHPVMRLHPLIAADFRAREPLADALAAGEPMWIIDGGWLAGFGLEQANSTWMERFTQLPAIPFVSVSPGSAGANSAIVRQASAADGNWFYVLNPSPWPLTVTVEFSARPSSIESLAGESMSLDEGGDGRRLTLALEPYELRTGRMEDTVVVAGYSAVADSRIASRLQSQLDWLISRVSLAEHAAPMNVLDNPGFEPTEGDRGDFGWFYDSASTNEVALQGDSAFAGSTSLSLTSTGSPVLIRSNEFRAPVTGRLSISVWIRVQSPRHPPLRISVLGSDGRQVYYRFGNVEPSASDNAEALKQWRELAVHFDDLPPNGDQPLRIGFELMGAGQVEFDDVRVYDRWLDKHDANAIVQQLQIAGYQLTSGGNLDKCRHILEGYWPAFLREHFPEALPAREKNAAEMTDSFVEDESADDAPRATRLQDLLPSALRSRR